MVFFLNSDNVYLYFKILKLTIIYILCISIGTRLATTFEVSQHFG